MISPPTHKVSHTPFREVQIVAPPVPCALARKVRSTRQWKAAMNQFGVLYGERFTGAQP